MSGFLKAADKEFGQDKADQCRRNQQAQGTIGLERININRAKSDKVAEGNICYFNCCTDQQDHAAGFISLILHSSCVSQSRIMMALAFGIVDNCA